MGEKKIVIKAMVRIEIDENDWAVEREVGPNEVLETVTEYSQKLALSATILRAIPLLQYVARVSHEIVGLEQVVGSAHSVKLPCPYCRQDVVVGRLGFLVGHRRGNGSGQLEDCRGSGIVESAITRVEG